MDTNKAMVEHFQEAIRIKTDWPKGAQAGDAVAEAPLLRFQDFLAAAYPHFNKDAERTVLSPYSVVYRWSGSAPSGNPILILAHYDVVPVEQEKWTVDPFGAEIKDGYIYGRGSLDMKSILVGVMEGAEALCVQGFRPREDVWFAFGGDEERSGLLGAYRAVQWFTGQKIHFSWILDEGTPIAVDMIKGIREPLALFGIEEKGYLSMDLVVRQKPGHASQPPAVQAVAVLGAALARLVKKPFPFTLSATMEEFFASLAPHAASKGMGWVMAHARFLGNIFFKAVAGTPSIAAMLHTTVAMTQLFGSAADNVMPSEARAVINLRLLSPWTVETALDFVRRAVADDRVEAGVHLEGFDPVPANPEHALRRGPGWQIMENALQKVFPGIPALPFLMVATTDSRHYKRLAGGIFRFNPFKLNSRELSLIHGHDERISLENLYGAAGFYRNVLEQL